MSWRYMNAPDTFLRIETLGIFRITLNGKSVASDWPNEGLKVLFCSLLSPFDLCVSWDALSRAVMGEPDTSVSRRRMEETMIKPLVDFLFTEFGFNPLIVGEKGVSISRQRFHLDSLEFNSLVTEGLRLLSRGNHDAAHNYLAGAESLYVGSYLPGITNKIIDTTRTELESLYRTAVMDAIPLAHKYIFSGIGRRLVFGQSGF